MEQSIALSKYEMPWVSWELLCVKFGFDPLKTHDVLLYVTRAAAIEAPTPKDPV